MGEEGVGVGVQWNIFVFSAADELRCWRSAERTAGRENQELGAELVSAVTGGLFTVTGKPDLGGYSIACLLVLLM